MSQSTSRVFVADANPINDVPMEDASGPVVPAVVAPAKGQSSTTLSTRTQFSKFQSFKPCNLLNNFLSGFYNDFCMCTSQYWHL
ncbi:hypothetical protein B9Z55_008777 [Caenorhabditis nigoni]|uniref:Uncharacterized protein n=1 Tax=Caenorhabditis nigoni TaxID=1611254 RepID=A0A2G5UP33_9PELO|nr:hypothetical protein B9Z55_008777 [Caenorhabditis nigoni]